MLELGVLWEQPESCPDCYLQPSMSVEREPV